MDKGHFFNQPRNNTFWTVVISPTVNHRGNRWGWINGPTNGTFWEDTEDDHCFGYKSALSYANENNRHLKGARNRMIRNYLKCARVFHKMIASQRAGGGT